MSRAFSRLTGDHRGLATTVVTCLVVSGVTLIGFAVAHQQAPSPPPLSSAGSPEPPAASDNRRMGVTKTPVPVVGPVLNASAPVSLVIPAIDVRSPLQRLGQNADGSMEVPAPGPRYDEAGWYRHSPTPGSLGPAVIAGHVDSATTGPSVFFRLSSLRPGDTVRVTRADGSVAVFAVDDVRRFRKSRFPTQLVYGNTDHAALRLITCGGPIVGGHYRDNVVVLASLIPAGGT